MGCGGSKQRFNTETDMNTAKAQLQATREEWNGICVVGIIENRSGYTLEEVERDSESGDFVYAPPQIIKDGENGPFFHRKSITRCCDGSIGSLTYRVLHDKPGGECQVYMSWDVPYEGDNNEIDGEILGNETLDLTVQANPYQSNLEQDTTGRFVWTIM